MGALTNPLVILHQPRRIFLICTVRNISDDIKTAQEAYVRTLEAEGATVHYPPRDTNQTASGIDICRQNFHAILNANEVHVFYNETSQGIHFDMGMAFALGKKIVVASNIPYGEGKSYARMLDEWELLRGVVAFHGSGQSGQDIAAIENDIGDLTFAALMEEPNENKTIRDQIALVNAESHRLTNWENAFIQSVTEQFQAKEWLSDRQQEILGQIAGQIRDHLRFTSCNI